MLVDLLWGGLIPEQMATVIHISRACNYVIYAQYKGSFSPLERTRKYKKGW